MERDRKRWDEKYRHPRPGPAKGVNPFLKRHIHSLPKGRALDLACGEAQNAVFLAQHVFEVEAIDISSVALQKAEERAKAKGVRIRPIAADLDTFRIEERRYDLIANFYFLDRRLIPKIKKGLKKGGRVIFETYLIDQRNLGTGGPRDPKYFLRPNELLRLFSDFRVLFYREGIFREGGRRKAIASLIAQK